jgi:hypothetical protein
MATMTARLQSEPRTKAGRPRRYDLQKAKPYPRCGMDRCQNRAQSADCPFCSRCQQKLPMFDDLLLITATS